MGRFMYLVTGATGGVGRRIVRLLRERDLPVRAFVRLTSRYGELENRGAEIFIGDLRQDRDIQKACQLGLMHLHDIQNPAPEYQSRTAHTESSSN